MAVNYGFNSQYNSIESFMRTKFHQDFPDMPVEAFDFWFIADRVRANGSGRKTRYSSDDLRFMSESFTWRRFWPEEEFPGTRAIQMDHYSTTLSSQSDDTRSSTLYRGRGRANYIQQHRGRGRGSIVSVRGGRRMGGRGQSHGRSTSHHSDYIQYNVGSDYDHPQVNDRHHATSSFEQHEENLIDFVEDETTTASSMQGRGYQSTAISMSAPTQNNEVAGAESDTTIVCRQCGVNGHSEIDCPYEIVMKQTMERERYLACGFPGHRAFRFNSHHGCLECKEKREKDGGRIHVAAVEQSPKLNGATGVKSAACGMNVAMFNMEIESLTSTLAAEILEDNSETGNNDEQSGVEGGGEDDVLIVF